MKYIIKKDTDTKALASAITSNSALFGDEILSVEAELNSLRQEADKFGCILSDTINNFYGGKVEVVAYPAHRRHKWTF